MIHNTVRAFVGVLAIVAALAGGYYMGYSQGFLRGEESAAVKIPESGLLVELIYSGGDVVDPENATERILIFQSGEVYKITRSGELSLVNRVYSGNIKIFLRYLNQENIDQSFTKKDRSFCMSSVDGVDQEIILHVPDGIVVSRSNCDYNFSEDSVLLSWIDSFITI